MKKYRLTYYGMSGFDYTHFDTQQEALDFVERQTKLGLMTPLYIYKYNAKKDEYVAYIKFKKVG